MRELQEVRRRRCSGVHVESIIFCDQREQRPMKWRRKLPEIVASHPARVLLLLGERATDVQEGNVARLGAGAQLHSGRTHRSFSEQVTLPATVEPLPSSRLQCVRF